MKTIKAYKTELKPNNKQASKLEGCCGYARFVYNWALAYWIDEYKRGEKRTGWMKLNTNGLDLSFQYLDTIAKPRLGILLGG